MAIAEAPLHCQNAACMNVHGHEGALNLWNLTQRPHRRVRSVAVLANVDNIARLEVVEKVPDHPANVDAWHLSDLCNVFDAHAEGLIGDVQHHRGMPPSPDVNIAQHLGVCQSCAPGGFFVQHLLGQFCKRAVPSAALSVVRLKRMAQGVGCHRLAFLVERRAHAQSCGEEFIPAEVAAKLAADFVGEIIACRHGCVKRCPVARLHGQKRFGHRTVVGFVRDIAIFMHFLKHEIAPRHGAFPLADGMIARGRLGQGCQVCSFFCVELCEGLVEIGLRCRRHTIGILAQENLVEIKFEDAFLVQCGLDPRCKDDLLYLAFRRAVV